MENKYDVIVVGGGMAGAFAAHPLVCAGKRVLMLDGGVERTEEPPATKGADFADIRRTDPSQHELFLGRHLETLSAAARKSHAAAMMSGNRSHVGRHTAEQLPLSENGVHLLQSLAKGGLSEAWGGVCAILSPQELEKIGLPSAMHQHYQTVLDIAGISGVEPSYRTQSSTRLAPGAASLLERYRTLDEKTRTMFPMRQPLLALLTEEKGDRNATRYADTDYYASDDRSIYHARFMIEEMERHENFSYRPGVVVQSVGTKEKIREVTARDFSGETSVFHAPRVILAAGTLNTTRIVMQSLGKISAHLFVKPNRILACLDLTRLGARDDEARHSLCQLTLEQDDARGESEWYAHIYMYRSLLLWRLQEQLPLPAPEALSLLALFAPSLVLVDARVPGTESTCEVRLEHGIFTIQKSTEAPTEPLRPLKRFLRRLRLLLLYTSHPPLGASAHYAGGVDVGPSGEIEGIPGVYAADASAWKALPAKPSALTIMAGAHRVGENVLRTL